MDIMTILGAAVQHDASDIYITAGRAISFKINGQLADLSKSITTDKLARELVLGTMSPEQKEQFEQEKECNYSVNTADAGRFRASAFYQRGSIGVVLRRIKSEIPSMEELGLPKSFEGLAMLKRGLIVFVGATGSGKSTSLAAIIGHRNRYSTGHILTIEDPIEFDHAHQGCIVTQREVGVDTESYEVALKNSLRQAPDVIMIGEVRTTEGMHHAITFAETGHLCLTTLHTNNANQALDRITGFFEGQQQAQQLLDLSLNLRAIIAQRLIPTMDGKGRVAAFEILLNTPLIAELVAKGKAAEIKDVMKRSTELGMQTFDKAVFDLYAAGKISEENALKYADSANEVRLMIKLKSGITELDERKTRELLIEN